MRGLIIGVVVVAVLAILAFLFVNSNKDSSKENKTIDQEAADTTTESSNDNSQSSTDNTAVEVPESVTIVYTNTGFSPKSAMMKVGGSLTWTNNSDDEIQLGVNPHPGHTGDRSITGGEFVVALGKGESKTIVVSENGTFGYHNHLNPDNKGTITVQ